MYFKQSEDHCCLKKLRFTAKMLFYQYQKLYAAYGSFEDVSHSTKDKLLKKTILLQP